MKNKIIAILLIGIMILSTGCVQRLIIEDDETSEFAMEDFTVSGNNKGETTTAVGDGETQTDPDTGEIVTQPGNVENPTEPVTNPGGQTPSQPAGETATQAPTQPPSQKPTQAPTQAPTQKPTSAPTQAPTQKPTSAPTPPPSKEPSHSSDVDTMAKNIVSQIITSSMSSVEKVVAIHDYIVYNVDFDYDNFHAGTVPSASNSADGALKNGKAVSSGYASAFNIIAKAAGFEVAYVDGVFYNGESYQGHAWNEIKVDGVWYNVDTTWDDPSWSGKSATDHHANCYDYFLVSDATLSKDHVPSYKQDRCSKDYSRTSVCAAVAATKGDSTYITGEADIKAKVKAVIDSGYTEFYVYSSVQMSDTTGKLNKAFVELKHPYYVARSTESAGGISKYVITKKDRTYCVSSQAELNAVIAANKDDLYLLEIWYYDAALNGSNFDGIVNSALIKTGYSAEIYTNELAQNGYVVCKITDSSTVIINNLSDFGKLLNQYAASHIATMKFAYIGGETAEEIGNSIFNSFVPKGWFPSGLYMYGDYGVKFITMNDIRPVVYAENVSKITQYVKTNGTKSVSTGFAIKATKDNCNTLSQEIKQNIETSTSYKINSSYNYMNGYMMFMIESIE